MFLTDDVVKSFGPATSFPSASGKFLVFRVLKPESLSHDARPPVVAVPEAYRWNISLTASPCSATM